MYAVQGLTALFSQRGNGFEGLLFLIRREGTIALDRILQRCQNLGEFLAFTRLDVVKLLNRIAHLSARNLPLSGFGSKKCPLGLRLR